MNQHYKEQDEAQRQANYHKEVGSVADTQPRPRGFNRFLQNNCDWVLIAGNRITMKVFSDRYSKEGGYITQKKIAGSNDKPVTEYHDSCVDAMLFAQETIKKGKG